MKPDSLPMDQLEVVLRRTKPGGAAPGDLHASLVHAVRAARGSSEPARLFPFPRSLAVTALAALLALGIWWFQPAPGSHDWMGAGVALEQTRRVPEQASAAMLAPWSQEIECLNRDLQSAVQFLVASVP